MLQTGSASQIHSIALKAREEGKKVAFVPTMGALHEGHLSLIRQAVVDPALSVVSIFVNPTQFSQTEDFENYPRDLERDLEICETEGVDLVFTPSVTEIYPEGPATDIPLPSVALQMEGEFRPGHFAGVCSVVKRLFDIVQPDIALFGEKDFQQIRVIEEMVREQKIPVKIIRCPTIRDKNGLALSSRNARLPPDGYQKALAIPRAIRAAQDLSSHSPLLDQGEGKGVRSEMVIAAAQKELAGLKVDYVTVAEGRIFIAAWVEGVRLIDNVSLLF